MQILTVIVNLNLVSKVKDGKFSKCTCTSHSLLSLILTMDLKFGVLSVNLCASIKRS